MRTRFLRFTARAACIALIVLLSLVAESSIRKECSYESSCAYTQTVPDGLSRLEQKANDLQALIQKILFIFTGIGIAFCGFRFIQGDPHAWKYTITVVVGATIVFASGEIMQWLQR